MATTCFRIVWLTILSLSYFYHTVSGQQPETEVTRFAHPPIELTYFEDSEKVIYHDVVEGDIWVSQNEGKTWKLADNVPPGKAVAFVAHPFNKKTGFIITQDTTHYRTDDQGKTWRHFEVPAPPAVVPDILSFHSGNPEYVLYQGETCKEDGWWGGRKCNDATWYTTDQFDTIHLLLTPTRQCRFAHSSKDFKHSAPKNLVFCVASNSERQYDPQSTHLYSSTDFFDTEQNVVTLPGGNRDSNGVVALAFVSKFAVVAVRDLGPKADGEMWLYVSLDAQNWVKGQFPHTSSSTLKENAYTIVESTMHSLAVDVLLHPKAAIGTLFVSNSNGTYFVESLQNTNRNPAGFVDYETIYGVEGVGLANIVNNALEVEGRRADRQIKSFITFDDGSNWAPVKAPSKDVDGKAMDCDISKPSGCSLNLHSVTSPHNLGRIFSSPAPGFVIGVGSVGNRLLPYEECDTFLSTDGGVSWKMIGRNAHKYEFGDKGTLLVIVNDEVAVDSISYSTDSGESWHDFKLPFKIKARALTTVPDSTSQKFLLIGTLPRGAIDDDRNKPHAAIFLDFAPLKRSPCTKNDMVEWTARNHENECVMGHKQVYMRKRPDADCYIGGKFDDPVAHETVCDCTEADYECDFNYIRVNGKCEPRGREPAPPGACEDGTGTYEGSSGYRLIPGNTCKNGINMAKPIQKDCSRAQLPEGQVSQHISKFDAELRQHEYFKNSQTILALFSDGSIWQSSSEGFTWRRLFEKEKFVFFSMHKYANERAYLITSGKTIYRTSDTGRNWKAIEVEIPANTLGIVPFLSFHPQESDWLIWIGSTPNCQDLRATDCRAEAYYSTNNGDKWNFIERYVKSCAWARDVDLKIDKQLIICSSYRDKKGSQNSFTQANPLELWRGSKFYKERVKLFDNVIGFTKFAEYLIVAEYQPQRETLDLQVSLDGNVFSKGLFPPSLRLDNHAYTILESSTDSVFLHLTISEKPNAQYGHILKSNSNGTFYSVSLENANRNNYGFVDFEKMIGLDGIALVNIVANPNPNDILMTGHKKVESRITHNDGGTWKSLNPPKLDSNKNPYPCQETRCYLHIHGYTERRDPRTTYSTPSVPGLLMAVGNVGEELARYEESDTFLSRDAGYSWEEVHKDAHLWEIGDSGSILVMANDEGPTDHVLFSTDQGLNWKEHKIGDRMRVQSIVTVPSDTSRKFILFGFYPSETSKTVAVQVDFTTVTKRKCVLSMSNSNEDDFELWSPSEERGCLFGRKTLYHRRIRDQNCYVGDQPKELAKVVHNCTCTNSDFECEFNHIRNADNECVLQSGLSALPSDDSECKAGGDYWYDRTAYRKIPFSTCEGGPRPDHGTQHQCPGPKAHGALFWILWICFPFAFCALVAWWYTQKSGLARGNIRLQDYGRRRYSDSGMLETLASIPYFLVGLAGIAWEWVSSRTMRSRRGYRTVPIDEDAQVLRFEDDG